MIEGNTVVQPEGRALRLLAIGPVHVHGNRLVSRGAAADADRLLRFIQQVIALTTVGRLLGTTASPLGIAQSKSAQVDLLLSLLGGAVVSIIAPAVSNELFLQMFAGRLAEGPALEAARQHLEARRMIGGNVLFNDNQVMFDSLAPGSAFSACAILLLTLDDVVLNGNQSDCDLIDDFFLTNALAVGFSIRATSNRFKTTITNALLSAATYGFMNMTATNQGTHCFLISSFFVGERTDAPNHVLYRGMRCQAELLQNKPCQDDPCARIDAIGGATSGAIVGNMVGGRVAILQP